MRYPFKSKEPTVSLCMIVKNEADYIRDCLASVQDVVDEIIVVDTGCEDNTLEIVQEFGGQVHDFAWDDNFAAARNESIRHATSDWIFQIDADERLLPESKHELRRLLRRQAVVCVGVLIDSPKANEKKGHISRAHRLFRNLPGIRYSGRVHEQISPSVAKLNGQETYSTIKLSHLGYAKSSQEMQEKSRRNYELLKKQIEEEPANPYWHYSLAQNQILSGKYNEALSSLKRALEIGHLPKDIRCSIFNNLAEVHMRLRDYTKAVHFAEKSLEVTKRQTTAHLLLNEIHGYLGDRPEQIRCLESVVDITRKKKHAYHDVSLEAYVDEAMIYTNLGWLYFSQKKLDQARTSFTTAQNINKDGISALRGLADTLIELGEAENAIPLLERIAKLTPSDGHNLEKLALVYIKSRDFSKAAEKYARLLEYDPGNRSIHKRLAALYYKTGDVEKSRAFLARSRGIPH